MTTDPIEDLRAETDALEASLADAGAMTRAFSVELHAMRRDLAETTHDLGRLSRGFSTGLRRAFDGLIFDGDRLSDALKGLARSMADTVYNAAMRPITDQLGGLLAQGVNAAAQSLFPFADGAALSAGRVRAFARGGVVSGPTTFPMRGGTGLMGEAGPEAIMPLARGPDGRLGVAAGPVGGGARPVQVTINVTTPDVAGFRRSRSQIAAEMSRALSAGQRNR